MFGNRSGHKPPRGGLESIASILGSVTTIVTSLLVLGALLYVFGVIPNSFSTQKPQPVEPDPLAKFPFEDKGLPPDKKGKEILAASNLGTEKQAIAFARAKQKQAVSACDDAARVLDQCLSEISQFESLTAALLKNDDGKLLAGDASLLKRFRLIHDKDRPLRSKTESYQQAVAEIAEPIRASLRDAKDVSLPRGDVVAEMERILAEAKLQREIWRNDRNLLAVLVAEAKRTNPAPAPKTLAETMRLASESEMLAFTQAMEKEANKAKAEMDAKLIQAKADGIRAIEQANIDKLLAEKRAEAERIRTEAFVKEAKEKAAAEAARAKAEKERLVAKAMDPAIKQKLAPILAKTIFQPVLVDGKVKNDHVGGNLERISFTRLKSVGALEPTREGLAALAAVGCYVNRHPHWLFSPIPAEWSAGTRANLEEVQALLRELGPTLVEERLLER
jgi:hypothetical protein